MAIINLREPKYLGPTSAYAFISFDFRQASGIAYDLFAMRGYLELRRHPGDANAVLVLDSLNAAGNGYQEVTHEERRADDGRTFNWVGCWASASKINQQPSGRYWGRLSFTDGETPVDYVACPIVLT